MTSDTFEQDTTPRLNAISEELHAINTEILANLETLPEQTERVGRLIERCDDIALDLDALQMELGIPADSPPVDEEHSPESTAGRSGLKP